MIIFPMNVFNNNCMVLEAQRLQMSLKYMHVNKINTLMFKCSEKIFILGLIGNPLQLMLQKQQI